MVIKISTHDSHKASDDAIEQEALFYNMLAESKSMGRTTPFDGGITELFKKPHKSQAPVKTITKSTDSDLIIYSTRGKKTDLGKLISELNQHLLIIPISDLENFLWILLNNLSFQMKNSRAVNRKFGLFEPVGDKVKMFFGYGLDRKAHGAF